ncbi:MULTISPECIES: acetyl-CoA carboxylase biotin carboxyl carrier protein [Aliarcobacter]|jgi:acetyl-CoA carboxylase biotin carboxyl carrier protein|uniref:Biotin carboxyl carrier protein of acetyl-CoA carboxylase n=2 Tax=Aliarcobacter skirrowii TaxID=28200 RepID=A0AAD0SJR2_9BACT|nr:acetyl-CoA carboxylase biotin carboxyl carrier protein [Aliarcobacter skirrowii]AXX83873.1 acetyl-CoA carboxylase, biotin carboxyl carrier protein [Aliarcobacter skirrowii CCUG 10374]AZL53059.1 acetyl-CoA carboxylase biotin carboxyl carrier protein [Aliarcobacter skirrowii]KAB0621930.1 acetyl-CoA carboxylase biotin carboxyl carrier protein [Aliarcobacter skirrowii CCUG 10374]MDX4061412.1 acetyl-CoA carboxylase biotin carboxyl carrier protein [Aliarcobacter skirrowii]MDX4068202.1 acetyl-CoA 
MDFKDIKELIRVFDKSELNKLRIKEADFEISMQRGFEGGVTTVATTPMVSAPVASIAPTSSVTTSSVAPEIAKDDSNANSNGITINAPMVGTYYSAPSPDAPQFCAIGDIVRKGQTLCILEAMKIMNEVEAEFDCKIIDILVQNGSPVEYDMPIFVVEKI